MSNLTLKGNASGSGTFIVESPNSANSRTITLPDATTTLVGTDATQTLTNKTLQGGALTQASGATLSGTSTDLTGIPSWARRVTIFITSLSTSGASNKLLQIGSGSILTTGYVASCMNARQAGTSAGSVATNAFIISNDDIAAYIYDGVVKLHNPTGNTWFVDGIICDTTGVRCPISTGRVSLSGALDRLRFTTAGGTDTFDGGSFTVMYEG